MISDATLDKAAAYWACLFQVDDKRDAYREALRLRLDAEREQSADRMHLQVDYDPFGPLLAALHDIGIKCRGMMFSATGLFPNKHRMRIEGDDITVIEGYGAPDRRLP